MGYILKHFDTPLLRFSVVETVWRSELRIDWVNEDKQALLPLDLTPSSEDLSEWLRRRVILRNRDNMGALLKRCGLNIRNPLEIVAICRGLSLNDSYWVVEDGFDGSFDRYNLYENRFSRALGRIALTGEGGGVPSGPVSSPELTTDGMLPKCWRRVDGRVRLYKGGTSGASNAGFEPYSEYYAAQIAEAMGISAVRYYVKGEERNSLVYLADYDNINRNTFYAVNQFTYVENGNNRRPDIIVFINCLPLVLIELKSPSKDEVGAENAYNQIRNYMQDIPGMFYYNAFCVISDLSTNKAGTITSGLDRFMEWKTVDGSYENMAYAQFDTFYEGMFQRNWLMDIIKNFILFSNNTPNPVKILAGYHQYFAVLRAIEKAKVATATDGKGGVFWHTQGSGKSLSMVFYAHLLQAALDSPTIVVMTYRIDLDDQLYTHFSAARPSCGRRRCRRRARSI